MELIVRAYYDEVPTSELDSSIEPEGVEGRTHHYHDSKTDSRGEWTEVKDICMYCGVFRTRRTEYSQNGLVTLDEYTYEPVHGSEI